MMVHSEIGLLFKRYRADMVQLARMLLLDGAEADDAVSEVFSRLMERPEKAYWHVADGKDDGGEHRRYLLRCVRNECLNIIGKKSRRERILGLYSLQVERLEEPREESERQQRLSVAIENALTAREAEVFRLRFSTGLKYREIAGSLQISEQAVYKLLSNALRKVKNYLTPNGNEDK